MHRAAIRLPSSILALAFLAIGMQAANAADLPKRKPGLWEIQMRMDGMPGMGPLQQCIDANTDNLLEQKARAQKSTCSTIDVKTTGNTVVVHAVCQADGSTVTTDAVFEGTFDSAYTGKIRLRYTPPLQGMSESNLTQEARWRGPCLAGQKPGDVILPNLGGGAGGVNLNEMMKDPKIQEMMRSRQK